MKTINCDEKRSINDRICIIRNEFFDNDNKKIAQVAGIDQSNMSRIISGNSEPSSKVLRNILNGTPELSADWLMLGQGNMRRVVVNVGDNNSGNVAGVNNGEQNAADRSLIELARSQQRTIEKQQDLIEFLAKK